MNSFHYYRDRAAYYRRAALETNDPDLRSQFENLANDYSELAQEAERGQLTHQQVAALKRVGRSS